MHICNFYFYFKIYKKFIKIHNFYFIYIYIYYIYKIKIIYIYIYIYNFYFYIKLVLFWFLWISKHIKFIFKTFCEYVFKIFVKRIDHFAACNLFSSWICVQDEDLHCCSCIYLSANSLSNGNVQRCSRCKARRYLVMALCTAVIGLADWTHLIINFLIFPMRSSCCMQEVKAGFISSARCAKWNKSWNFLVMQKKSPSRPHAVFAAL